LGCHPALYPMGRALMQFRPTTMPGTRLTYSCL